jgi:hypothetical protein
MRKISFSFYQCRVPAAVDGFLSFKNLSTVAYSLDDLGFGIAKSGSSLCLIRIPFVFRFLIKILKKCTNKIDFDSHVRGLNEYSCAHEAHIKFGDVTPYLIYGLQGQKTI